MGISNGNANKTKHGNRSESLRLGGNGTGKDIPARRSSLVFTFPRSPGTPRASACRISTTSDNARLNY